MGGACRKPDKPMDISSLDTRKPKTEKKVIMVGQGSEIVKQTQEEQSGVYTSKDGKKIDSRDWDRKYDLWIKDANQFDKPGPHPQPDHAWNTHPEIYKGVANTGDNMANDEY